MVMRVSITRSGGFAGITEQVVSLDTANLPVATAGQVEASVRRAGLLDDAVVPPSPAVGADMYRYDVSIDDTKGKRSISFSDDGGPEVQPLREMVDALTTLQNSGQR